MEQISQLNNSVRARIISLVGALAVIYIINVFITMAYGGIIIAPIWSIWVWTITSGVLTLLSLILAGTKRTLVNEPPRWYHALISVCYAGFSTFGWMVLNGSIK